MTEGDELVAVTGSREMLSFLEARGHEHVFGLTGSSIVSVFHEMARSKLDFVPAVHEAVAVAMADGYARVRGSSCVFLYMLPGTANGIGNLYNAWRDESPLMVVTAQQSTETQGPQATVGEADLVRLTGPFTRRSWEVRTRQSLGKWLALMERASTSMPTGPTFLSVPRDVLQSAAVPGVPASSGIRAESAPVNAEEVVFALSGARRPLLVAGGQVRRSGGSQSLEDLAVRLSAPVLYEPYSNDRLAIDPGSPYAFGPMIIGSRLAREADVVVLVGCRYFNEVHPVGRATFEGASFVAHINADHAKIDEHHPASWTAVADPASFLASVLRELNQRQIGADLIASRRAWLEETRARRRAARPDDPADEVSQALADVLADQWMVDESVTASPSIVFGLSAGDGARYLATTGGSLGWGTGAACGVALASGEAVTCVLGDGALMFGLQGLWTAAARRLPITFVILDNGGYGSTRFFEREYVSTHEHTLGLPGYVGSDLRGTGPSVASLVRGFGIPTIELKPGASVGDALASLRQRGEAGPKSLVVPIAFE